MEELFLVEDSDGNLLRIMGDRITIRFDFQLNNLTLGLNGYPNNFMIGLFAIINTQSYTYPFAIEGHFGSLNLIDNKIVLMVSGKSIVLSHNEALDLYNSIVSFFG